MTEETTPPLAPGSIAPHFALDDTRGRFVCIDDFWAAAALVVAFPGAAGEAEGARARLAELAREFGGRLAVVEIGAGGEARGDEPGAPFPRLLDETGQVARTYGATAGPRLFLFDAERKLVREGAPDEAGWAAVRDALARLL